MEWRAVIIQRRAASFFLEGGAPFEGREGVKGRVQLTPLLHPAAPRMDQLMVYSYFSTFVLISFFGKFPNCGN